MAKFSKDVLERSVFPFVHTSDPDVLLGTTFGEDVALTRVGGDILVSHVDPIVGAIENIGWLAVHVACNDVATSGSRPRWLHLLVLVPSKENVELLGQIMQDASRAAKEIGASIIGGHSGYSSGLSRALVAVTALATTGGRTPILSAGARPGDHILVTKGIGLEGTAILAQDFAEVATDLGLDEQDLAEARRLFGKVSVVPEALLLAQEGATSMHDVTRGGILVTLLEMAYRSEAGIEVDFSRLPIPAIVARFAEAFSFEPIKMISSGTLVAAIPEDRVESAIQALDKIGVAAADIGRVSVGQGVDFLKEGEKIHHQDIHCEEDELARLWERFPRHS